MNQIPDQHILVLLFEINLLFPVEILILVKNIDNEAENVVVSALFEEQVFEVSEHDRPVEAVPVSSHFS